MDKKENSINDYQEQYDILLEEEQDNQRKKAFWIVFFCLVILLFAILGATYSYYKVYTGTDDAEIKLNIDTDGDGKPDLNIDLNGDGVCDLNCDTNNDLKPDLNIDYMGDLKAHFNLDLDGDGIPDTNLINQNNKNGLACTVESGCDLNCDTTGDNHPNINIDLDGDGKPDINIDTDCDGKPDLNIDTDGDGKPDLNIDTDGDGKPDRNVDSDGDGVCDTNCDNENIPSKPNDPEKPKDPIVIIKPSDEEEKAILFLNYTKGVNIDNMLPDTTVTQTFTVENQSKKTLVFSLNWINVTNEFVVPEGFTYQIKKDGFVVSDLIPAPKNESNLVENVIIPAETTYSYEIDYTFHNLVDKDQTADQNKTFSAQIIAEIIQQ